MRVLVTGGAGFIGSHIVELLIDSGHKAIVVDNLSSGRRERVSKAAKFYRVDLAGPSLGEVFERERPEVVIHQAAQVSVSRSVREPLLDARVNVLGSLNLLEQCRAHGTRKVIFASTAAVYGDPQRLPVDEEHPIAPASPYGVAKRAVEEYLRIYRELYGLDFTVLRYANVYGPRQDAHGEGGVVAIFTHRIVRGEPIEVHGDGEQTRDLVHVRDVARANVLALERGGGELINVSRQSETSVNELARSLGALVGRKVELVRVSPRSGDIRRSVLANEKARRLLDWRPEIGLMEGLAETVDHEIAAAATA